MDGFRLFLPTSGPTKRRKHYLCLLFSQYWVGVEQINVLGTSPRNQFRDYSIWDRIEKLMPQHCTNFLKLLKLYEKRPTCFQTLTFCWTKSNIEIITNTNNVSDVLRDQMSRKKWGMSPRIIPHPSHLPDHIN